MWLRKTFVVFLNAQNDMGGKPGSWKNVNYNTYEKIQKSKNYMGLYGWQGRFWAISLDFSAAPGNHLQSQTCYICLLYPPLLKRPQHNVPTCCSSYVRLYVKCSLFNESESPPFCPGWGGPDVLVNEDQTSLPLPVKWCQPLSAASWNGS